MNLKRTNRRTLLIYLFLLIALSMVLLIHAQYSFCQSDEPFYISTVKRLYQGDRLILDEWHPTQFYAPILLPFYAAFRLFASSDEGVILYFRLLTIMLFTVCGILLFLEIKREHSLFSSFCSATLLMLFSRANILGASYYNLNLLFTILFYLSWENALRSKGKKAAGFSILSGLFISLAVLCQPFSAMLAIGFLVFNVCSVSTRSRALWTTITILLMGLVYIVVFLMKDSFSAYVVNLEYVLKDPQHQTGILNSIWTAFRRHGEALSVVCCSTAAVMSVWFIRSRKNGEQLTDLQKLCQIAIFGLSLIKPLVRISVVPCYSYFAAITIAAFPTFCFYMGKKEQRMATKIYALGLYLAVVWAFGSNTTFDAMLVGYTISGIGGILLIAQMLQNTKRVGTWKNAVTNLMVVFCSLVLLVTLTQRITGFYRDAPINQLDTRIEQGPAKGLITTAETAEQYNEISSIIRTMYRNDPEATTIHLKKIPWAYLACDWKCYGPSSWTTEISGEQIREYYELHDNVLPDYWIIYSPEVGRYESVYMNNHKKEPQPNAMVLSGDIYNRLTMGGYNIMEYPYMTVFISNLR